MSISTPSGSGFEQPTDPWASSGAGSSPAAGASSGTADQAKQVAGTAADHAQHVAGTAAEQAQHVAGTAAEQAQHVAGTAAEQAQHVAGTAAEQAQNLFSDTRGRLQQEAGQQQTKVVEGLRSLVDELGAMTSHQGESGVATDLARRGQGYVRSAAEWLDNREPGELVGELRRFAQRRPGAFLAGAVVAGLMAGRLTRGATAQAREKSEKSATTDGGQRGAGGVQSSPGAVRGGYADPYLDSQLPAVTPGPGPYDADVAGVTTTPYGESQSGPYGTSTYSTPTQYGAIPDDTSALPNRPLSQP